MHLEVQILLDFKMFDKVRFHPYAHTVVAQMASSREDFSPDSAICRGSGGARYADDSPCGQSNLMTSSELKSPLMM